MSLRRQGWLDSARFVFRLLSCIGFAAVLVHFDGAIADHSLRMRFGMLPDSIRVVFLTTHGTTRLVAQAERRGCPQAREAAPIFELDGGSETAFRACSAADTLDVHAGSAKGPVLVTRSAGELARVPGPPFRALGQLGGLESQLTGVLAGFALTVAVMLLERRGSNNMQHRMRDASLYRAAIGVFVLSCGLGILSAALSLIVVADVWEAGVTPIIHAALGYSFALAAITMFYGLYLALLAAHQSVEYRTAHAAFFIALVLGFLFTSYTTMVAGVSLLNIGELLLLKESAFFPIGMLLAGGANYWSEYWHHRASHAGSVYWSPAASRPDADGDTLRKRVFGHASDLFAWLQSLPSFPRTGRFEAGTLDTARAQLVDEALRMAPAVARGPKVRTPVWLKLASWAAAVAGVLFAYALVYRPDRWPFSLPDLIGALLWALLGWLTLQMGVAAVFRRLKAFESERRLDEQLRRGERPTSPSGASRYLRQVQWALTGNAFIALLVGLLAFALCVCQPGEQGELKLYAVVMIGLLQFATGFSPATFLGGGMPAAFSRKPGFDEVLYSMRNFGEARVCCLFWRTEESEPGDEYFVMLKDYASTVEASQLHERRKASRKRKLASADPTDEETDQEYMYSEKRDSDSPEPFRLQSHWTHRSDEGDAAATSSDSVAHYAVTLGNVEKTDWMYAVLLIPESCWEQAAGDQSICTQAVPPRVSVVFFDSESAAFFWGLPFAIDSAGAGNVEAHMQAMRPGGRQAGVH
ncbi:MAG: hypothetical protein HZA61_02835 [Candidatus Eisenbacteria bacterium]|uniref:Uncharacterized protein n=1 Tax=Eiseniibacteriota bacterium TaxID=2212470 RepID=A0A933W7Y3_UNCEI|nr:hypothetical protein [Candidatus Eisenbacteria bacterium]